MEQASELQWLQWFYSNADFGPAHGDQMMHLINCFEQEMQLRVPADYRSDYDN